MIAVLEQAQVPVGKSYTAADIHGDAHYQARGMLERHELPGGGALTVPGIVPKLSATPGETRWLGPALGAHTAEVLRALGFTPEDIARLRQGADG